MKTGICCYPVPEDITKLEPVETNICEFSSCNGCVYSGLKFMKVQRAVIENREGGSFSFSAFSELGAKRVTISTFLFCGIWISLVHSLRAFPAIFLVSVLIFHSAWALEFVPEVWEMLTQLVDAVGFLACWSFLGNKGISLSSQICHALKIKNLYFT